MADFKRLFKKFLGFEEEVTEQDELQPYKGTNKEKEQINAKPITIKKEMTMYPKTFEDACDVVEQLEIGNIVIVNMNDVEIEMCKRISDFILGAVYVLGGEYEKLSKRVIRFWKNK